MSALDEAITAELQHPAGSGADPLTDSLYGQLTPTATPLRAGWENEPIEVPVPWRWGALVVLITVVLSSLLMGCGGGDDDCPPEDPPTTDPVDCTATPERCR